MDIRIDKSKLLRGLYLAHGIADRKSHNAILANVLIRSEGVDRISCAATDLKVTMVVTLSAKVEQEGGVTVGARQAFEIAKGLSVKRFTSTERSIIGWRFAAGARNSRWWG